jgi:hypothetical protein
MADPTVTDVFNQLVLVNGKLDQVEVNTAAITNVNVSINKGFNDTVHAIENTTKAVLTDAQVNVEAVKLLFHLSQQVDTMICAIEHVSKNTCEILTQVTMQTRLQERMCDDLNALRYIAASVHSEAELERRRHAELRAEIEQCCPPELPQPACKYEPCESPKPANEPHLPNIDIKDDDQKDEKKRG